MLPGDLTADVIADGPGTVLVLNGTSSSGKTSLARALQRRWPGPLLEAGLDRHLSMLPRQYLGPLWSQVYPYRHAGDGTISSISVGPVGAQLHRGMHRAVAALARAGCDVVLDHVLLERWLAVDLLQALDGVPTVLVGVQLPREVLAERERGRADRTLGQALAQLPAVHGHGGYDVEADTSVLEPGRGGRGGPGVAGHAGGADRGRSLAP